MSITRAQRLAHARGLLPSRRRAPGPARRDARFHGSVDQAVLPVHEGYREAVEREPHLPPAHGRYRRRQSAAGARLGFLRPDDPRLGRAVGSPQVAALRVTTHGFDIPVGKTGDCFGATWFASRNVSERRIRSSAWPRWHRDRPVRVDDRKISPAPREGSTRWRPDHHSRLYTGLHVPHGETYTAVEPQGESASISVRRHNKPYRKIRARVSRSRGARHDDQGHHPCRCRQHRRRWTGFARSTARALQS